MTHGDWQIAPFAASVTEEEREGEFGSSRSYMMLSEEKR